MLKSKFLCEKSQVMQLKNKLAITKSQENFVILRRFGHLLLCITTKKNAISMEECYPLNEQTMRNSIRKLKLSLFSHSDF